MNAPPILKNEYNLLYENIETNERIRLKRIKTEKSRHYETENGEKISHTKLYVEYEKVKQYYGYQLVIKKRVNNEKIHNDNKV